MGKKLFQTLKVKIFREPGKSKIKHDEIEGFPCLPRPGKRHSADVFATCED